MRKTGAVLLAFSAVLGLIGLTMDVSVGGVNNIGLLSDRSLAVTVAGFLFLGGLTLLVLGGRTPASALERRQCPQCAELVKSEATVCRFCGFDLSGLVAQEAKNREKGMRLLDERRLEESRGREEQLREQSEREGERVAFLRKQRDDWRQSHRLLGWLPVRSNGQAVGLVAAVSIITAMIFVIGAVGLARNNAEDEMLSRLQGTWSEYGGAGGSWVINGRSVKSSFPGQSGELSNGMAGEHDYRITKLDPKGEYFLVDYGDQVDRYNFDNSFGQITSSVGNDLTDGYHDLKLSKW